eukprot:XP_001691220.1 predicted protein [Chlamydomonas reinhardtii]
MPVLQLQLKLKARAQRAAPGGKLARRQPTWTLGSFVSSCGRTYRAWAGAARCLYPAGEAAYATPDNIAKYGLADVERGMDAAAEQQQGGLEKLIKALDTKPVVPLNLRLASEPQRQGRAERGRSSAVRHYFHGVTR